MYNPFKAIEDLEKSGLSYKQAKGIVSVSARLWNENYKNKNYALREMVNLYELVEKTPGKVNCSIPNK